MVPDPAAFYRENVSRHELDLAYLDQRCRWSGLARGLTFLAAAFCFFAAFFQYRDTPQMWWGLFAITGLVFLFFVIYHGVFDNRRIRVSLQLAFFRQGLARIARDWPNISNPMTWVDEKQSVRGLKARSGDSPHPKLDRVTITDLDLEGEKSLWRLLNLARTPSGQAMLHQWMLQATSLEEIQKRQDSVKALADADSWRHEFLLSCWGSVSPVSSPATIMTWAAGPALSPWLTKMILVARLSAAILLAILLAGVLGLLSPSWLGTSLAVLVIVNFLVSVATAAPVHEIFRHVSSRAEDVRQYDHLLEMIASIPVRTEMIEALQKRVTVRATDASQPTSHRTAMRQLLLWSMLGNLRSGVTFIFYVILQFACLWDLHILAALEKWRLRWGQQLFGWFDSLGELEALAVLAQCRYDHPHWVFPQLAPANDREPVIFGDKVGHPLLGHGSVANPVALGPWNKSLVVTGSNMSGKSTYLRAVGANLILGRMGAAVDAAAFRMPAVEIGTSMRVADSLADGVSFFMSELRRLKQIVDRSREFTSGHGIQYVYLLDEILQGTNSQERQIAVTRVIQQLLARKAIGAISTHDLQLPDVPELAGNLDIVHFKESFVEVDGKQTMTFDYLLRPGITPTTNALKLLALVGLDATE
ncbi:MAG: hypothetical protein JNL67_17070 [Planctomycetaceae bacterium]|nr:hypothetical protein [Planctomycetaceae bacterium]